MNAHRSTRRWTGVAIAAALAVDARRLRAERRRHRRRHRAPRADEIAGRPRRRSRASPSGRWAPTARADRRRVRGEVPEDRRASSRTSAPATTTTPSCRTRSRRAPACPTSRRSSTTHCRSSPCPTRSSTSPSSARRTSRTSSRPARGRRSHIDDGIYGLPQDSGPMAMFYNEDVFDTAWASRCRRRGTSTSRRPRSIHAADPNAYITNDIGDAGFTTSMIWQAGGQPYRVDGNERDRRLRRRGLAPSGPTPGNRLLQNDLVAPIPSWSDEWYQGLGRRQHRDARDRRLDACEPRVRRAGRRRQVARRADAARGRRQPRGGRERRRRRRRARSRARTSSWPTASSSS